MEEGLPILQKVRETVGVPVTSDFSDEAWAAPTGEVVDLIQVPAYLCRQTHILRAAGATGKPVNIKKGQFMDPRNMRRSVEKIKAAGNPHKVIVTERGSFMGYDDLVNDMRGLQIMREQGHIVCYDATHSIQRPTGEGNISGGQRNFIPGLVRAAAASGIHVLFMEIHDDPNNALSDPATQIALKHVEKVLAEAKWISEARNEILAKWGEDDVD